MKVLVCCPLPLKKTLGGAKVYVELADALKQIGHEVKLIGPSDVCDSHEPQDENWRMTRYAHALKDYLNAHGDSFDVIDYDHQYLPFRRNELPNGPVLIARSVLLVQHLDEIQLPRPSSLKGKIADIVKGPARREEIKKRIELSNQTIDSADGVIVSNYDDIRRLAKNGVSFEKMAAIPYGIGEDRRSLFTNVTPKPQEHPVIISVGTFDYRKGALDWPKIVDGLLNSRPDCRFLFLGCKGLFQSEEKMRSFFSSKAQERLEFVLSYRPEELPELLSKGTLGIFPSYYEGFPFGVVEMLSAGLPVFAYDAPGAPMMLEEEALVCPGDTQSLVRKVMALLENPDRLEKKRLWAKTQGQRFLWKEIAQGTIWFYERIKELRTS